MSSQNFEPGADSGTSAEAFIEKLKRALRRDGDFPTSAKIVAELKALVADPNTTANQITEVILREPSLGTRVLHLVNSSFYRRAKPIMTVSQAVVQIGMRPLAELCAGLILLQRFVPAARERGAFATCLHRTITTSLLASSIGNATSEVQTKKSEETGYLAGTFFELGSLLVAYYFPKIYVSAVKRSEQKQQPLSQSLKEITGMSAVELSVEVIQALNLPPFYAQVVKAAEHGRLVDGQTSSAAPAHLFHSVFAAKTISHVLVSDENSKEDLDTAIVQISRDIRVETPVLQQAVGELPKRLRDYCSSIELTLPELPEFVETYIAPENTGDAEAPLGKSGKNDDELLNDNFQNFLRELRDAVNNREPTASIITSVMETLAFGLLFDRVILLLVDQSKKYLHGRMALGQISGFDPQSIKRPVGPEAGFQAPDAVAYNESRPVFQGNPILNDGWPIAAIPIGFDKRVIGVLYADRIDTGDDELSRQEQASIGVLAELLDRSMSQKS